MPSRKEKLEELFESFQTVRRIMVFRRKLGPEPKITPAQWIALRLIEGNEEMSVKELAQALGITSSAATQLSRSLIKEGYVTRAQNVKDRRSVVLKLSRKTKTELERMKKITFAKLNIIFKALRDYELDIFLRLHKKLSAHILK